jgi:signal transduction histidine kinase
MRNPMASVLAGLQALERAGSLSTEDSFILKLVIAEARSAIAIIERFTNSLRTGTTAVQRVPVDGLLQNVLTEFGERARKVQISLELMPGPSGIWVAADEQALSRALEKLTYNALEACEKSGSIHLGWRVLAEEETQQIFPRYPGKVLAIFGRDSGDGLPPHLPQRSLFEPFVTTKPAHVGLGLPVARRIVENHGGVVTLSSLVPEGTQFEVFLPLGERLSCSEVMAKQTADDDDRGPCEACEVKEANAGEICWVAKSRSDVSGQGFPPQTCTKCPFFEASNLVSFFKPSGPR